MSAPSGLGSHNSRFRISAVLIAFLCLFVGSVSQGLAKDNQLWGAVLLATNGTPPEALPSELKPYQQRLERIFGYSTFQVLGKSSQQIEGDREQWLIPGKMFSVRSQVQPTSDSNFQVDLRLYRDKKELVQTVAKLGTRSPLFIRGPLCGNGQLIIAIMVRDDD
ncbi:MAG TPA: hypothetical protein VF585_07080 [Chthoniobacterales bacterium]|jgi:hypothetical protein